MGEEEDAAAAKIQAMQRGRIARKEVVQSKEEAAAAKKIQALQRGRMGREKAKNASQEAGHTSSLFVRPFELETDEEAVIRVNAKKLNATQFSDLDAFATALKGEVGCKKINTEAIYYSTASAPAHFSNVVTSKKISEARSLAQLEIETAQKKATQAALVKTQVLPVTDDGVKKSKVQLTTEEKEREKKIRQGDHQCAMVDALRFSIFVFSSLLVTPVSPQTHRATTTSR